MDVASVLGQADVLFCFLSLFPLLPFFFSLSAVIFALATRCDTNKNLPPSPPLPSLPTAQRMSCSYLLCTILLFVAVLLAVTVTGTILFMNHYQAPPLSDGLPHISTNQDEANALVTVERGDGSRINIFIDPNCPDYNSNFLRLEGVQTSLLHSLTDHDSDLKSVKGQDRALLVNLAEEVAKLSAHAGQLKMDYEALRRGQGNLGQDLNTLQAEQGRLIQVRISSDVIRRSSLPHNATQWGFNLLM